MASKLIITKDYKKRRLRDRNYFNNFCFDILKRDNYLPKGLYYNKKKQQTKSRFHARCLISGRARAVLNKFRMSRMIFKKFASKGLINGVKKTSW